MVLVISGLRVPPFIIDLHHVLLTRSLLDLDFDADLGSSMHILYGRNEFDWTIQKFKFIGQ